MIYTPVYSQEHEYDTRQLKWLLLAGTTKRIFLAATTLALEKNSWTPFHQRGSQRGLLHTKKKHDPLLKSIKKTPS